MWGWVTQTAHILGHFRPFFGHLSGHIEELEGNKRFFVTRKSRCTWSVATVSCVPLFGCFEWVEGLFLAHKKTDVLAQHGANHLEERLLHQAQARTLTPPFWEPFAQHTRRHDIGCLTPCKIIIFLDKRSPNAFFDFEASTPLNPNVTF